MSGLSSSSGAAAKVMRTELPVPDWEMDMLLEVPAGEVVAAVPTDSSLI